MTQQTRSERSRAQGPLAVARGLYGGAFDAGRRDDVGVAMEDWSELSEAERSFAMGHLLYLNLSQQAENGRVLQKLLRELEAVGETVEELADAYLEDSDELAPERPARGNGLEPSIELEEAAEQDEPPVGFSVRFPEETGQAPRTASEEALSLPGEAVMPSDDPENREIPVGEAANTRSGGDNAHEP